VSRREAGRGLREVKQRQAVLAARAAFQRAELARRAEGLSAFLRWATLGWAVARALRTGVSPWGASGSVPNRPA
jgi:hypothetical protein